MTQLANLSVSEGPATRPGLLLIQIDGLSIFQFRESLHKGELPFLKSLIRKEKYQEHRLYSGLPSSTPAVQAELLYGVKTAVPTFAFLNRENGEEQRMYYPDTALKVEQRLMKTGKTPLVKDGSTYSNNFTGGAAPEEVHFCASALNLKQTLRTVNPLATCFVMLTNLTSVLRVVRLIVMEIFLSLLDFSRGMMGGRNFIKELKFIPTRVGISIMLREMCVIGGKIDLNRGLPIVHINFLGYDEQSHRRGPHTKFARWALKGIDYSIKRLWREAGRAQWRNYELWIYSDHGQSTTTGYGKLHGYTIQEALQKALCKEFGADTEKVNPKTRLDDHMTQCLCSPIGGKQQHRTQAFTAEEARVVGLGPVGLAYFPSPLTQAQLARIAKDLCHNHGVPAVIYGREEEQLRALTRHGEYLLPDDMATLFGEDHPFLQALGPDLDTLCRHPDAGEIIMLGWCKGEQSITFAMENGSHAGLTHEETSAFMLLPQDVALPETENDFYRPLDLRSAALHYLGREKFPVSDRRSAEQEQQSLRIMTYNVHSCIGMDGKLDVERIARVIARANPDVVALQELDVGRIRTDGVDQAEQIAHYLEMEFHFNPSLYIEEGQYGNAILTHLPMKMIKAGLLPGTEPISRREPRGALWVSIDCHGTPVHIINTHLGLSRRERVLQTEMLLGDEWLGNRFCDAPIILCGDFNALPSSWVYKKISEHLQDAQVQLQGHRPRKTFYSGLPMARIDYIFVSDTFAITEVHAPSSRLSRMASDHLPLIAELNLSK